MSPRGRIKTRAILKKSQAMRTQLSLRLWMNLQAMPAVKSKANPFPTIRKAASTKQ